MSIEMSTRRTSAVASSKEANNLESIAADAKAQIGKLETCFQKQMQKMEAENAALKAGLESEKNKNIKLEEKVKNLKEKLLESQNSNKKVVSLLQTVKKGATVMKKITGKMQQHINTADSTVKLVQRLYSRVEEELQAQNEQPTRVLPKRKSKEYPNNSKRKRKNDEPSDESYGEEEDVECEEFNVEELDEECSDEENNKPDENKSDSSFSRDVPEHFQSGNFLLLKSDVKWDGDTVISKLDELNLMKIEGKALLQKYIPMNSDGKILHKCTCVYTGWNVICKDKYYSVTELLNQNPPTDCKDICVALDLEQLIKVRDR